MLITLINAFARRSKKGKNAPLPPTLMPSITPASVAPAAESKRALRDEQATPPPILKFPVPVSAAPTTYADEEKRHLALTPVVVPTPVTILMEALRDERPNPLQVSPGDIPPGIIFEASQFSVTDGSKPASAPNRISTTSVVRRKLNSNIDWTVRRNEY